jgi:hypothetical protein
MVCCIDDFLAKDIQQEVVVIKGVAMCICDSIYNQIYFVCIISLLLARLLSSHFGIWLFVWLNSNADCHSSDCCHSDHSDHHRSDHCRSDCHCSPHIAPGVWSHGACSVVFWPLALQIKKMKENC